jgi:PhnB protein
MAVQPIPEGYNSVNTYLAVDDAAAAIEFYQRAFGAKERGRMPGPEGKIAHAELQVGDSVVMLGDQFEQSTSTPPKQLGGTSAAVYLYVEDVDAVFQQAIEAGASELMPPQDMFWGDRWGKVSDPFGHEWDLATHKEDLSDEEIAERGREAMAGLSS